MEIKRQEATNCFLMKASCNDENYQPVELAYIELDKKTLMNWLELREKLADLKLLGVKELILSEGMTWFEDIPEELEEHLEALKDEERFEVESIPEDFLNSNEMRMDGSEAVVNEWGVSFKGFIKHTSVEATTWSMGWETIVQALKNCDPQSVRFIKEEDAEAAGEAQE